MEIFFWCFKIPPVSDFLYAGTERNESIPQDKFDLFRVQNGKMLLKLKNITIYDQDSYKGI